jgi:hypothetical protein
MLCDAINAQPQAIADFSIDSPQLIRDNPDRRPARDISPTKSGGIERRLTPAKGVGEESPRSRGRGLAELSRFDLSRVNKTDRLAQLMRWQLQVVVDGERFADTRFHSNSFRASTSIW